MFAHGKSLLLAVAAALVVLSGCSTDDDSSEFAPWTDAAFDDTKCLDSKYETVSIEGQYAGKNNNNNRCLDEDQFAEYEQQLELDELYDAGNACVVSGMRPGYYEIDDDYIIVEGDYAKYGQKYVARDHESGRCMTQAQLDADTKKSARVLDEIAQIDDNTSEALSASVVTLYCNNYAEDSSLSSEGNYGPVFAAFEDQYGENRLYGPETDFRFSDAIEWCESDDRDGLYDQHDSLDYQN